MSDKCKHETSIWGRCESCGMTWDEQAAEYELLRSAKT
jgi:hypothetical protein